MADPPRELRSSELEADAVRRGDERSRRKAARALAIVSLVLALACATGMIMRPAWPSDILRTGFSAWAASFAVMTVRAIDGPLSFSAPRRNSVGHSDAVSLGLIWLGWFAAIMAAVLLAGIGPITSGPALPSSKPACKVTCVASASGVQVSAVCEPSAMAVAATC